MPQERSLGVGGWTYVDDVDDMLAMVQDDSSPFFTSTHFDGHLSALLRASRISEIGYDELAEVVHEPWRRERRPVEERRGTGSAHRTEAKGIVVGWRP